MSAGVVGLPAHALGRMPSRSRMPSRGGRPPLRLVASDGRLRPDDRFGPDEPEVAREHAGGREYAERQGVPGTRITRRGRLVITLVMTGVVVAIVAVVLATSVDAAAPQIDHATTVSAGQTLSEVAYAQLPGLPVEDAVARIQLVNGLNTTQVHAGQSLLIPALP